jgi:hypothetical protein
VNFIIKYLPDANARSWCLALVLRHPKKKPKSKNLLSDLGFLI